MSTPRSTTYVVRPPRGQENLGAARRFLESRVLSFCLLTGAMLLAACGEKPQVAATKKADDRPWEGAVGGQVVTGWKVGDQASWEEQLKMRSQRGQNEYTRASAQP